jgi:ArsR family transcriptional regulator
MRRHVRQQEGAPSECFVPGGEPTVSVVDGADVQLARFARSLGHPARVAIVRFLLAHGRCVCCDIAATLPLAQSTVSQHLRVLREAGLICGEVEGPHVCYCVHRPALAMVRHLLAALESAAGATADE